MKLRRFALHAIKHALAQAERTTDPLEALAWRNFAEEGAVALRGARRLPWDLRRELDELVPPVVLTG